MARISVVQPGFCIRGGENDVIFNHTLYTGADPESSVEGCNFKLGRMLTKCKDVRGG